MGVSSVQVQLLSPSLLVGAACVSGSIPSPVTLFLGDLSPCTAGWSRGPSLRGRLASGCGLAHCGKAVPDEGPCFFKLHSLVTALPPLSSWNSSSCYWAVSPRWSEGTSVSRPASLSPADAPLHRLPLLVALRSHTCPEKSCWTKRLYPFNRCES